MTELDPKWIRVSSILSMIPSQAPDGKWCYPMQNINQEVLQRKADLGTSVHAAISAHAKDVFFPIAEKEEGYLASYLRWEMAMGLHPVETEIRLYSEPMRLTGCVDMISTFKGNSKLFIIDFKCTVEADPVKWPIQAALYHLLAAFNNLQVEKTCLFVQLDAKGGDPNVYEYEITKSLTATALSFYNAYMYLTRK